MFELGLGIGFIIGVAATIMWVMAKEKDAERERIERANSWIPQHINCRCTPGASLDVLKGTSKVKSEFDARKALANQRGNRKGKA